MRNEKQMEFYLYHKKTLNKFGASEGDFTIKTAFFSNLNPLPGKNIQMFEGELKRNKDMYIELIEKVKDHTGRDVDLVPDDDNRPLLKYCANPHYRSEYPVKTGTTNDGKQYDSYLINLSELKVLWQGVEYTFAGYEKAKKEALVAPAQEQKSTNNDFPDFEEQFPSLKTETASSNQEIADVPMSEMTLRDLAAIMLIKPVSAKPWLNELIKQTKSEI